MNRPSFFIVGAPKCGTTSLHAYIGQHQDIFLCEPKEPHFFGEVRLDVMPALSEAGYLDLFREANKGALCGEASTGYLVSETAAREIHAFQPDAKIVMILRNPADRAYSHYLHNVLGLREDLSFRDALVAEERRIAAGETYHCHYHRCGLYGEQIARYLRVFSESALHVILFEDLKRDPGAVCQDLFKFLGLERALRLDVDRVHNPSAAQRSPRAAHMIQRKSLLKAPLKLLLPKGLRQRMKGWLKERNSKPAEPMDPGLRIRLIKRFRADRIRCERLIKRDLSTWAR